MAKYVDGFILVVPKDKAEEYRKMAEDGKRSWMENGALAYFECRGDNLVQNEMDGEKTRDYKEMARAGVDDDVWFSFIIFESKERRDEINKKVMSEMNEDMKEYEGMKMPFDMKQMAYGGFVVEVEG